MTEKNRQFMETLDEHHDWPCPYVFKFILPTENLSLFEKEFSDHNCSYKESRTGKYTSVTMEPTVCSAAEVMEVYERASDIPGIMSL
ncbi:DUF493 family protein [Desulfovibrio oxyclinae]|jgi:hypothetical protein|uniref:DUF493 family protein n=1 Tax=Desulfovibrio oxyclinae TaxID=63560 RepID=UPI00035C7017|nr:DUF493 family protein [Desulfovibrio oxyclinae]